MTIRTRLTLWYGGMLLGSLLLMGGVLRYELVGEYERGMVPAARWMSHEPPRTSTMTVGKP